VTSQSQEDLLIVQPHAGLKVPHHVRRTLTGRKLPEGVLPKAALWERRFVSTLLLLDIAVVCIAIIGGLRLRLAETGRVDLDTWRVAVILVPAWIALLAVSGAYDRDRLNLSTAQFRAVLEASVRMAAVVAFYAYLTDADISRGFFLIALPGGFLALLLGRVAAKAILIRARANGQCLHRVLAVGTVADIEHLIDQLEGRDRHGLHVMGACTVGAEPLLRASKIPVLGRPSDARRAAAAIGADTVAVTSAGVLGREGLRRLAWQLEGSDTGLLVTPELTDVAGPRVRVRPVGNLSMLQVSEPKFTGGTRLLKGAFDRVVAAAALIVLSPLFLAVAVAIKLDSRGSVFFRQTRSGIGGRPFQVVKFRSMVPTAEHLLIDLTDQNEGNGALFKMKRDPRVTRVGRTLRRFSIDELPQLWNVVIGDMSLVGPRPPLPTEVEQYEDDVRRRLLVKPGLTGLWQVSGRSDLSWEESVRLDLYYVENWSFVLDVIILARTAGAVVAGRGAY
jgi:exopolysaccharide biosynthesis polyprenyl glycosylphosphotransferase